MSVEILEILFLSHEAMFIFFKPLLEINAVCCGFVIYIFSFFGGGQHSYSLILIKQGDETDVEITASDTRSKQPQPTTGSSTQSQSARSQSHLEKTSDHPIVSETGSKQPQLTTGSLTQSLSAKSQSHSEKASDHTEQITEIGKQFPDVPSSKVHHYLLCTQRNYTDISKEEHS